MKKDRKISICDSLPQTHTYQIWYRCTIFDKSRTWGKGAVRCATALLVKTVGLGHLLSRFCCESRETEEKWWDAPRWSENRSEVYSDVHRARIAMKRKQVTFLYSLIFFIRTPTQDVPKPLVFRL